MYMYYDVSPSVVEVQWDRGGHAHQKWDGSCKSATVEKLTSHTHNQLGSLGESTQYTIVY